MTRNHDTQYDRDAEDHRILHEVVALLEHLVAHTEPRVNVRHEHRHEELDEREALSHVEEGK